MEDISVVKGTLSTVLSEDDFDNGYVDYALEDVVLGEYEEILYDQDMSEMPGMDVSDYDTSGYIPLTSTLPASGTTVEEYFPHAPGDYSQPNGGSDNKLSRHVYENETFTDVCLPAGRNSLFKNCTFEGILFVGSSSSNTNNVRFENCQFNGVIVTGVPKDFYWTRNVLYFTGSATFNNTAMEEATILAPNFNVNLGNTQELVEGESVLTGAIVGGIVDIRGNAKIEGTILSMYDPTSLGSGARAYGTNVGFSDENNEAGVPEDRGTIEIKPTPERMLPSGMKTPIIFEQDGNSYVEY
jgi:hypothetical protein